MSSKQKLKDLTINITDGKHGDCENQENSGYYFISSKDINNGYLSLLNARQITKKDYEETHKRTKLAPHDILITNSGTIGKLCFIKSTDQYKNITFQKSVAIIKPDPKKILPEYLYYLFSYNVKLLIKKSVGSVQKNLLLDDLRKMEMIYQENEKQQRRISEILSVIDDKIRLNAKINAELENIAKTLYNYWFVQLDFLNKKGKPYKISGGEMEYNKILKREIPKGWKVENVAYSDITKLIDVGINKYSGTKIYLSTSEVENSEIINHEIKEEFNLRPSRANMQPVLNSLWFARMKDSKKIILVSDFSSEIINNYLFSTGFAGLKISDFALYYVWNFINDKYFEKMKNLNATGSTQKGIINESIINIPLVVPNKEILKKFNDKIKYFYMIIYKNQRQNLELIKFRDFLLPLLMNGQVKIK